MSLADKAESISFTEIRKEYLGYDTCAFYALYYIIIDVINGNGTYDGTYTDKIKMYSCKEQCHEFLGMYSKPTQMWNASKKLILNKDDIYAHAGKLQMKTIIVPSLFVANFNSKDDEYMASLEIDIRKFRDANVYGFSSNTKNVPNEDVEQFDISMGENRKRSLEPMDKSTKKQRVENLDISDEIFAVEQCMIFHFLEQLIRSKMIDHINLSMHDLWLILSALDTNAVYAVLCE